jgi:hypothetical protein
MNPTNKPKIWLMPENRLRKVNLNRDNWAQTVFGSLDPGHYRVLPAAVIDRAGFSKTPEAFAGFPCPYCSQSVLRDLKLIGYPNTHLYGCGCTAVVITLPYGSFQQWHWVAFANAQRHAETISANGGAQDSILMGVYSDEETS